MRVQVSVVVLLALAACSGPGERDVAALDAPNYAASDARAEGRGADASPPDESANDSVCTSEDTTDTPCVPDCTGKVCGDDDGCGGNCTWCPPTCGGSVCEGSLCGNLCACNCDGKECGSGGCGGDDECGVCPGGAPCCPNGRCSGDCTDRECGDDGCFGSCGTCGEGGVCFDNTCQSTTWADPETGFVWQTAADAPVLTWEAAIVYCDENAGGLPGAGWRLPNISELRTLIKSCRGTETGGECNVVDVCEACGTTAACLAESTCFDDAVCNACVYGEGAGAIGFYTPPGVDPPFVFAWSSSSYIDVEAFAWVIDFTEGEVSGRAKEETTWAYCVREGP